MKKSIIIRALLPICLLSSLFINGMSSVNIFVHTGQNTSTQNAINSNANNSSTAEIKTTLLNSMVAINKPVTPDQLLSVAFPEANPRNIQIPVKDASYSQLLQPVINELTIFAISDTNQNYARTQTQFDLIKQSLIRYKNDQYKTAWSTMLSYFGKHPESVDSINRQIDLISKAMRNIYLIKFHQNISESLDDVSHIAWKSGLAIATAGLGAGLLYAYINRDHLNNSAFWRSHLPDAPSWMSKPYQFQSSNAGQKLALITAAIHKPAVQELNQILFPTGKASAGSTSNDVLEKFILKRDNMERAVFHGAQAVISGAKYSIDVTEKAILAGIKYFRGSN